MANVNFCLRSKYDFIYEPRDEKTNVYRGNRETYQRLCFRYLDSTIPSLVSR